MIWWNDYGPGPWMYFGPAFFIVMIFACRIMMTYMMRGYHGGNRVGSATQILKEHPADAGVRREAVEETGHRVNLYEFLGAITYRARGRPMVQFWRMKAVERPSRDIMKDIVAVECCRLPRRRGG